MIVGGQQRQPALPRFIGLAFEGLPQGEDTHKKSTGKRCSPVQITRSLAPESLLGSSGSRIPILIRAECGRDSA